MYRIKTKYVTKEKCNLTITCYTNKKWEAKEIAESHYSYIEYTEGRIIEQEIEKGYYIPIKKIYKYKLKIDGGH